MKKVRLIGAAAVGVAMAWAGFARADGGQVLNQVPDNATAVLEIKNLDELNTKISKAADTYGLTQSVPQLKDTLGALEDSTGISDKGLNKSGDLAVAIFAPGTPGVAGPEPEVMVLVPVSDYKQFLTNFGNAKDDGGGITEGTDKDTTTDFIAHWGEYAVVTQSKDLLAKAPAGIKLAGVAADEQKKDVLFYVNMDQVRTLVLPQLKDHRDDLLKQMTDTQQHLPANLKTLTKTFDGALLDAAQRFVEGTKFVVLSGNLTDDGIATAGAAEFVPDSPLAKLAAQSKGTDQPMLAGLPDRKYFFLLGMTPSKEFSDAFTTAIVDPVVKSLEADGGDHTTLDKMTKLWRDEWNDVHGVAGGAAVPGQVGKDGLIEMVQLFTGDANAFKKDYTDGMSMVNDFMKNLTPAGVNAPATSFVFKPDATTVGDVHFDQYTVKMDAGNGPQAMQMQMMMNMLYGPGGPGGYIGVVNDKTVLQVTGVDDQSALMADSIASAKTGKDVLSDGKGIQSVKSMLPKQRVIESYFYLDQLIGTGVHVAQSFGGPIKIHVPADLPPIGMTFSGDGNATMRFDGFFPAPLIQAMVGVGTDLDNMQHGGGGGGGGGL